jgi:5-methylthioadenosine/S-adenosylhomocysteine deaminase
VDLGQPETEPVYHPISHRVYAASRHQVTDVWVAGQRVLAGRRLTTLDLDETVQRTRDWREKIHAGHRA